MSGMEQRSTTTTGRNPHTNTAGREPCPSSAQSSSSQEIVVGSSAATTLPTGLPTRNAGATLTRPVAGLNLAASLPDSNSERYLPHHTHHHSHQNPKPVRGDSITLRHSHQHQGGGRDNDDRAYYKRSRSQKSHHHRYQHSHRERHHRHPRPRHHSDRPRPHEHRDRDHHNATGQHYYRPASSNNPTRAVSRSFDSFAQNSNSTREEQCRTGYPSSKSSSPYPYTNSVGKKSDSSDTESLEKTLKKTELELNIKAALLETRRIEMQLEQMSNCDKSLQVNSATSTTIPPAFAQTSFARNSVPPFAARGAVFASTRRFDAQSFAELHTASTRPFAARVATTTFPDTRRPIFASMVPAAAAANTTAPQPFAARRGTTTTTTQWPVGRPFAMIDHTPATTLDAPVQPFTARDSTLPNSQASMLDDGASNSNDGHNNDDDVNFSSTAAMDSSDEDSTIPARGTATRMGESTVRTDVLDLPTTIGTSNNHPLAVSETAATTTTTQSSKDDDIDDVSVANSSSDDDDNDDDDDDDEQQQEPSTRATPTPSRKRTISGRGAITRSLKRKLRQAQRADDELKKHDLLKAWEEDMAALKKIHHHTEKDLVSTFTPKIVDHCFLNGGEMVKYLIQWDRSCERDRNGDKSCLSWVSHEDFLFPALARSYFEKNCQDLGSAWIKKCEERERCLILLNTSSIDMDEYESQVEIDFCCYLCKCPWSHPMKNTLRSCENGLKFHRGCCHGYQDSVALESFVSPVGEVIGKLFDCDSDDETNEVGELSNQTLVERSDNILKVLGSDCSMYSQCLRERKAMRDAVVLCINAGVGSATLSLKALGISVGKIIHVEADRVAQHVYRSNHDIRYGEAETDDGIEHVVGLYESFHDVADDAENFMLQNGPIDIIICLNARKESKEDSIQFVSNFFTLVDDVEKFNRQHYQVGHLFYLLEIPSSIKDDLPPREMSCCVSERNIMLCNWPISFKNLSPMPELLLDKVFKPVSKIFDSLREALFAGPFDKMWRDVVHPKYWIFLGLGPEGYDLKIEKKELDCNAFSLRLRSPSSFDLLSAVDYANHLLSLSPSVSLLNMLLHPMKRLFNGKQYGQRYDELKPETGNNEHDPYAVKLEALEEIATHEESALFDQVDKSIAL